MNSRQRRKRRRRLGVKPPYRCFWCKMLLETWDAPCRCKRYRIRKLVGDLTMLEYHRGCVQAGIDPKIKFISTKTIGGE